MENLTTLKINTAAQIRGFAECINPRIARRLSELGFLPQEEIKVLRKSLLGRAYLVQLRFYTLTIRRDIARLILVEGK